MLEDMSALYYTEGNIKIVLDRGRESTFTFEISKILSCSPVVQNKVNKRAVTALEAVIKCFEEHKLHDLYLFLSGSRSPTWRRQKHIRMSRTSKPQPKRLRADGMGCLPQVSDDVTEKNFYPRITDRYCYLQPISCLWQLLKEIRTSTQLLIFTSLLGMVTL